MKLFDINIFANERVLTLALSVVLWIISLCCINFFAYKFFSDANMSNTVTAAVSARYCDETRSIVR
jgi:hypothetical protein